MANQEDLQQGSSCGVEYTNKKIEAIAMSGQMCWLSALEGDEKILHLRESPDQPWRPYTAFSLAVPDYLVPGGSKGYATMQFLFTRKWKLVGSQAAEEAIAREFAEFAN